jgi:TatD DNase family protein
MLVDTHCHLHFPDFDADREEVVIRAREAGVRALVNVGTGLDSNMAAYEFARNRDGVFHSAGLHPHHAAEVTEGDWTVIEKFIAETKPVAVGEVGLDYFKSQADARVQKNVFSRMIRLALRFKLPVIVHSRNAFDDTLEILTSEGGGRLKGVMHCFSYDEAALTQILNLGLFASFTPIVTFKNAGALLEVAKKTPLDRLLLETDSPYLAPQPHRGKRNEPAWISHLADFLAERRGISRSELENATTGNATRLFSFKIPNG